METFIKNLAKGAGVILRGGFGTKFKVSPKSVYGDVVTEYDIAAENFIIEKIKKRFPSHGIMAEESGHVKAHNFWVIDPLDATHAFARGWDQFSVSIAFVSHNKIMHGAVYAPMSDELFVASRNKGSWYNGKRIYASSKPSLSLSNVSLTLAVWTPIKERRKILRFVADEKLWFGHMESVALSEAYTACGRYDMLISSDCQPWDYAAGAIIMKEAGAKVTQIDGKPYRWDSRSLLAANPVLHKQVLKAICK
ncbi:MAG: inositol monophosphatase [bacterium]|nr:inositol monophosphatase [bacterium]